MKKLLLVLLFLGLSFGATAVQMDFLMAGVMDSSGKPLTNGKVYFYENNSGTTQKAVYADATMTSVLSQPVALNSSGVPTYIPYGSGTYKVVWKTSAGVTIKTVTGVQYGQQATSANGIIDVGLTYGYNNAAVQSAIDAAGASDYTLVFSKGEYTIGTSKTFPANVRVQFQQGAYWTISAGSIAVNGVIDALPDIFRGNGQVTISPTKNQVIRRDWWYTKAAGFVPVQDIFTGTANYILRQYYEDLSVGSIPTYATSNRAGVLNVVGTANVLGEMKVSGSITISGSVGVINSVYAQTAAGDFSATSVTANSDLLLVVQGSISGGSMGIYIGETQSSEILAAYFSNPNFGETRGDTITAFVPRGWVYRTTFTGSGSATRRIWPLGK